MIKSKLDSKTNEIKDVICDLEKKFVKLDDDYANISKYMFDLSLDCEKEMAKMDRELDKIQKKMTEYSKVNTDLNI